MKKNIQKFSGKINTAFLFRNFRNLDFEEKAIVLSNATTLVFCFFPWMSTTPLYGNSEFYSAFSGPTQIMGIAIFLLSAINISLFIDKIWQIKLWKSPLPENVVIGFLSLQQIVLIISVWSVLLAFGKNFEDTEIRFGISIALFSQIISLTANTLLTQKHKKKNVQDFFSPQTHDQK